MAPTVLSVGNDPQLLALREAVLRSAGFTVLSASDPATALSHMNSISCAVLLLCYSLPLDIRRKLASTFHRCCPSGRVVAITNEPQSRPPVGADSFLYGIEGAEALIETVSAELEVTRQKGSPG